jgi:predicted PurR-regulated permease PerM
MDRDLTIMIYGAIMGVAGSIISSLISTVFQFWLARREYERKQNEEQSRQLRHIHLPTDEEIIIINAQRSGENESESSRKTAEAGSLVLSSFVGGLLVYQTNDPLLGFAFSACLSYLLTKRAIRWLRR